MGSCVSTAVAPAPQLDQDDIKCIDLWTDYLDHLFSVAITEPLYAAYIVGFAEAGAHTAWITYRVYSDGLQIRCGTKPLSATTLQAIVDRHPHLVFDTANWPGRVGYLDVRGLVSDGKSE